MRGRDTGREFGWMDLVAMSLQKPTMINHKRCYNAGLLRTMMCSLVEEEQVDMQP